MLQWLKSVSVVDSIFSDVRIWALKYLWRCILLKSSKHLFRHFCLGRYWYTRTSLPFLLNSVVFKIRVSLSLFVYELVPFLLFPKRFCNPVFEYFVHTFVWIYKLVKSCSMTIIIASSTFVQICEVKMSFFSFILKIRWCIKLDLKVSDIRTHANRGQVAVVIKVSYLHWLVCLNFRQLSSSTHPCWDIFSFVIKGAFLVSYLWHSFILRFKLADAFVLQDHLWSLPVYPPYIKLFLRLKDRRGTFSFLNQLFILFILFFFACILKRFKNNLISASEMHV